MRRGLLVAVVGLVLVALSSACTNDFDVYLPRAGSDSGGFPSDTAAGCSGPGAKVVTGRCYFLTATPLGWSAAEDACKSVGGHLASVSNSDEETAVEGIGSGDRWIGLSRPAGSPSSAGSFRWSSGEVMTYLKWSSGEPSGDGECGRVLAGGAWSDHPCSSTLVGICER